MTEDMLGYTTTDSPSFAHMKLVILCCKCKYRRYWSPSRHGIHNLYRMSDEVTINLHPLNDWKISFLCPNAARYDVWYNNKLWLRHWHWGLDIHIYIYCKNANRTTNLYVIVVVLCCIVAERFGTRIAFTDLCQKMSFILHGMYICSCLIEQGTNKESINFQYNNQPNKYSHCQYKHDNIWALMYWSMTFYVAKQAYMLIKKA